MQIFELSQTASAIVALCVVGIMFLLFLREALPTEVVAIAGVALMLALGVLPYDAALTVLSNPAPWTIARSFAAHRSARWGIEFSAKASSIGYIVG